MTTRGCFCWLLQCHHCENIHLYSPIILCRFPLNSLNHSLDICVPQMVNPKDFPWIPPLESDFIHAPQMINSFNFNNPFDHSQLLIHFHWFVWSPDEAVLSPGLGITGDCGFNLTCQLVWTVCGKLFLFIPSGSTTTYCVRTLGTEQLLTQRSLFFLLLVVYWHLFLFSDRFL